MVDRDFRVSYAFQAYTALIKFIHAVKNTSLLVTIGEEGEEDLLPTLKIWDLAKVESDGFPELVRVIKLPKRISVRNLCSWQPNYHFDFAPLSM